MSELQQTETHMEPASIEPAIVAGDLRDYQLEHKKLMLEAGWLGKIFGGTSSAPANIVGLVLLLLTGTALVLILRSDKPSDENIKLLVPIITLALGYLFGRKT